MSKAESCTEYDTVISALGRDAIPKQVNLVRLAEESKTICRFFPSEWGTDVAFSEASTHEAVHQTKLAVRAYIRDHAHRLEHTFLMTGPYIDGYVSIKWPVPEIGSFNSKEQKAYVINPTDQKISWTAMPDVGRFVVAALLHRDVSRNRALKVSSVIASQDEIVAEFEKQTRTKWTVHHTSSEQLEKFEDKLWKEGSPLGGPCSLRRLWLRGETLYHEFDNVALGDPATISLATVVEQNLAALKV